MPITDLAAWHGENPDYAGHVAACCGGEPGKDPETDREYRDRSPISFVSELAEATISVHHGRFDPVVSHRQSWRLAQKLETAGAERFFFEVFNGGHDIHYERAFSWFDGLLGSGGGAAERLTG